MLELLWIQYQSLLLQITWEKNGILINDNVPKYLITSEGSLVIREVSTEDEGNYTCVAHNSFFTRMTQPAKLFVYSEYLSSVSEQICSVKSRETACVLKS